ncbi:MAG: MarR family winged helix-turn-helix transcriptional regulator, partial [Sediminibacterium sp.]|nr:MarR family winged helix-turn-helix transcriptional regulator [Sediminibacterium sp.]
VKRVASPTDRRINLVQLTDAAKDLQQITIDLANQTMAEALVGVDKKDIETVKSVFQKVYDNLTLTPIEQLN